MKVFAGITFLTCLIGIVGLLVFDANQRSKELGIRKVLGASVENIMLLLCRQYLKLFSIALLISLPVSFILLDKWLNSFAYQIEPGLLMVILPSLAMVGLTILVIVSQSLKTAFAKPIESLKSE